MRLDVVLSSLGRFGCLDGDAMLKGLAVVAPTMCLKIHVAPFVAQVASSREKMAVVRAKTRVATRWFLDERQELKILIFDSFSLFFPPPSPPPPSLLLQQILK